MKKKSKSELVLEFVSRIPRGRVTTYATIARACGTSPRAVGAILLGNKNPITIPCHRVVASDSSLGGYCGRARSLCKRQLLKREGIIIQNNKIDLTRYGFG